MAAKKKAKASKKKAAKKVTKKRRAPNVYSFSCSKATHDLLVELAEKTGRNKSNLISYLINNYAEAQKAMDERRKQRQRYREAGV